MNEQEDFYQYLHRRNQKPMDRVAARKNLWAFADVLEEMEIPFFLAYGTLLGAVRENDFILYDQDTDLVTFVEHRSQIMDSCLPILLSQHGFKLGRDDGCLVSFVRDDEYIDIYFFEKNSEMYTCAMNRIPEHQLANGGSDIEFMGRIFKTFQDPEADLIWRYGDDWRVPIPDKYSTW